MTEANKQPLHLIEEFLRLDGVLHRYFAWKHPAKGPHASPHRGQGRILSILKLQPEISQKELGYLLDIRPQSLTELLSKLEKAEFITRQAAEEDKRVMIVKLTEAGKAEAGKIDSEEDNNIFDVLSQAEQAQLSQLMNKVVEAAVAEMPEDFRSMRPKHPHYDERRGFGRGAKGHWHRGRHEDHFSHSHGTPVHPVDACCKNAGEQNDFEANQADNSARKV